MLSQLSYGPFRGLKTDDRRQMGSQWTDYRRPSVICLLSSVIWNAGDLCGRLSNGQIIALKEVIQPHLPIRLPCYDFTPVIGHTVASALLAVELPASGATNSHGVTGGVYKAR